MKSDLIDFCEFYPCDNEKYPENLTNEIINEIQFSKQTVNWFQVLVVWIDDKVFYYDFNYDRESSLVWLGEIFKKAFNKGYEFGKNTANESISLISEEATYEERTLRAEIEILKEEIEELRYDLREAAERRD